MLRTGDRPDAISDFEHARDIIVALGPHLHDNKQWPNHLSLIYNNIGLLMRNDAALRRGNRAVRRRHRNHCRADQSRSRQHGPALGSRLDYDNAGETWLRWAKSQSDSMADRSPMARTCLARRAVIRETLAALKPQWHQDLTYTDANLAAADAIELETQRKNLEAAGLTRSRRSQSSGRRGVATRRCTVRTIELQEWSAAAFKRAERRTRRARSCCRPSTLRKITTAWPAIQAWPRLSRGWRHSPGDPAVKPVTAVNDRCVISSGRGRRR